MVYPEPLLYRFYKAGRLLFDLNLVDSHSGNLSERKEDYLVITRRGARLGDLGPGDLVFVPLNTSSLSEKRASRELPVHRAIYSAFPETGAVAHAHTLRAVALSFQYSWIEPRDSEGGAYLKRIPVVEANPPSASPELARSVVAGMKSAQAVVVKGHGAFARGSTLEEAVFLLAALEGSARILLQCKGAGIP